MTVSGLSIPTSDEERTVLTARYGLLSWLDAGIGYAVRTDDVLWSVRTQLMVEKEGSMRPGLLVGTGSVRAGGSDQSVYTQIIKSVTLDKNVSFQLSAGVATILSETDEVFGLAGITSNFNKRYALFANYDGRSFHEGISWIPSEKLSLSFLLIETEYPAFSIVLKR